MTSENTADGFINRGWMPGFGTLGLQCCVKRRDEVRRAVAIFLIMQAKRSHALFKHRAFGFDAGTMCCVDGLVGDAMHNLGAAARHPTS